MSDLVSIVSSMVSMSSAEDALVVTRIAPHMFISQKN